MAKCRLDGIIATEANKAVIFRRGPSRLVQLLVWDLNTDEVVTGQWLKARVYTSRCDVSPNGEFLVIAATNYTQAHRARNEHAVKNSWDSCGWTAISRPPYFSAIGLWFTGGAWNGGGIFKSNRELMINNFAHGWDLKVKPPKVLQIKNLHFGTSEDEPIFTERLLLRGWQQKRKEKTVITNPGWHKFARGFVNAFKLPDSKEEVDTWIKYFDDMLPKYETEIKGLLVKPFANGHLERITAYGGDQWRLVDDSGTAHRHWKSPQFHPQWIDIDARGRVVFGEDGCLWAWEGFPDGEPKLIADLNPNKFEAIAPPEWAIAR